MNERTQSFNPLHQIVQSQYEAIMTYKWIESEKAGRDIGWECANQEWTNKHFPEWKRNLWDEAVQQAS